MTKEVDMRQTGRTAQQMLDAPQNAVYVWCNDRLEYPRHLASNLYRHDLRIVGPSWLEHDGYMGLSFTSVVLDHAFYPRGIQIEGLECLYMRAKINQSRDQLI